MKMKHVLTGGFHERSPNLSIIKDDYVLLEKKLYTHLMVFDHVRTPSNIRSNNIKIKTTNTAWRLEKTKKT